MVCFAAMVDSNHVEFRIYMYTRDAQTEVVRYNIKKQENCVKCENCRVIIVMDFNFSIASTLDMDSHAMPV